MNCRIFEFMRKPFYDIKMFSKMNYQEAVQKLNTLQSNKAALDQMRKDIENGKKRIHLEEMEKYLQRTQMNVEKLDDLAVIHIAGTKGKGSTSAMCESILRHHGFKTGFYSSPHLVVVRERIRINGNIISEQKFSEYFSDVYTKLIETQEYPADMPKYFHFLTVMAFHVFIKEKVDVVILEVGIGGADDSTNVVRNPYVVGITALGLDHTPLLGNTIEEIAKAKAGIMKPGCEAYTVVQAPQAMAVLQDVAHKTRCPLRVIPDYRIYRFINGFVPKLPVDNDAYNTNASLAIQLSHAWLRKQSERTPNAKSSDTENIESHEDIPNGNHNKTEPLVYKIPKNTVDGLSNCFWPGRYHRMDVGFAELYLDGAHTKESMDTCITWFDKLSSKSPKVLIFSATGDRNTETLLQSLMPIQFEQVYFVAPVPYKEINNKSDTYSVQQHSDYVSKSHKFAKEWTALHGHNQTKISVQESISDAFTHLKGMYDTRKIRPSVLITGSLYLVGGVLAIFNPNLKSTI